MRTSICAVVCASPAHPCLAQATFEPIPRPAPGARVEARHISADGRVVAGSTSSDTVGVDRLFRWTPAGGYEFIPGPPISTTSWITVTGISADGAVVCGFHDDLTTYRGFVADENWRFLPEPLAGLDEFPRSISASGNVIVGSAFVAHGSHYGDTIIWENGFATTPLLPQMGYSEHHAYAVSGDGEHVFGYSPSGSFHYRRSTGSVSYLPASMGVYASSHTGDILVGSLRDSATGFGRPAIWRDRGHSDPVLLHPTASGYASSMDRDGTRVVGYVATGSGRAPFLWEAGPGFRTLRTFLHQQGATVPNEWTLDTEYYGGEDISISADGRTIVGTGRPAPGAPVQAFRITLPPICPANCDGSARPPVLTVADLICFLHRFAANDPYANCDGSTSPPVLTHSDLSCFLQRYAAGCP
jgi:uncharacterized membrane protein